MAVSRETEDRKQQGRQLLELIGDLFPGGAKDGQNVSVDLWSETVQLRYGLEVLLRVPYECFDHADIPTIAAKLRELGLQRELEERAKEKPKSDKFHIDWALQLMCGKEQWEFERVQTNH